MKHSLTTSNSSVATSQSVQVVNPNPVETPPTWMQYGTSPAEIILATAVVIGAIAGVIEALAILLQVLVPAIHTDPSQKRK